MATTYRDDGRLAPAAWASWLNLILGLWMMISPFVVGYSAVSPMALWNGVVLGALIAIAGLVVVQSVTPGPSWWNVAFGVWLFFSPWILQFGVVRPAVTNDMICGDAVVILGLIAALSRSTATTRPMGMSPGMCPRRMRPAPLGPADREARRPTPGGAGSVSVGRIRSPSEARRAIRLMTCRNA